MKARHRLVKICGVTRPTDAAAAVELGADLVGLNFWPGSPRHVAQESAREIVAAVAGRARTVGVFVDQPVEEIEAALGIGIDLAQLHGDETPDQAAVFGSRAVKVFRVRDRFDAVELRGYPQVWGFLFDCRHSDFGGTGQGWPYELARGLPTTRPVMVAGGVRPGTAATVMARCDPDGLDVCSGVERAPGIKDHEKMKALLEEIRHGEVGVT